MQATPSNANEVIIYNRIPKTGSTSFIKVVNQLFKENQFSTLYLNISSKTMRLNDEAWIVKNISHWKEIRPVIFHGHFGFPSFAKFGSTLKPIFINIIRDPLQRFVSYYYFVRYGDDFRPHKKRSRMGDKTVSKCYFSFHMHCDILNYFLHTKTLSSKLLDNHQGIIFV